VTKVSSAAYKKIVAAVDGSPTSMRAANQAIHIAKMDGAELTVIHIIEDVKQGGAIGLRAKYGDIKLVEAFRNVRTESANKLLSPIIESAIDAGIKAKSEILVDEGESEAGAITRYAEKHGADLIVLGSKGRSKFERLLVGGVTGKIVNAAKCQVLIVR
jgi:nucleotide-binding universal stress UspA family protein